MKNFISKGDKIINVKTKYFLALSIIALTFLLGASPTHAQTFTDDLYFGLQGNSQVSQLQEFLTEQGVYSGPITGNFFSLTLDAVKQFQIKNGIAPAAGYFGPLTKAKANEQLSPQIQASENQAISETGTATPSVTAPKTATDIVTSLQAQIDLLTKQLALLQQQQNSISQIQQNIQAIQQNTTPPTPTPPLTPTPIIPQSCSITGTVAKDPSNGATNATFNWTLTGMDADAGGTLYTLAGHDGATPLWHSVATPLNKETKNSYIFPLLDYYKATFGGATCYASFADLFKVGHKITIGEISTPTPWGQNQLPMPISPQGTATLQLASDSPSAPISAGSQGAILAKYDFKPISENMEIRQIQFYISSNSNATPLGGKISVGFTNNVIGGPAIVYIADADFLLGNETKTISLNTYPIAIAGTDNYFTVAAPIPSTATASNSYLIKSFNVITVRRITTGDLYTPTTSAIDGFSIPVSVSN